MNKNTLLWVAFAFLAGAGAGVAVPLMFAPPPPRAAAAAAEAPPAGAGAVPGPWHKPAANMEDAQDRIAELEQENADLRDRLGAQTQDDQARGQRDEQRAERFNTFMQQAQQRREAQRALMVSQATAFFGLRPSQVQQMQYYADQQANIEKQAVDLMEKVRKGEMTREEARDQLRALRKQLPDQLDYVKSILADDQAGKYEDYVNMLDSEQKEATAYSRLGDLTRQLNLSEDQKTQLFNVFYNNSSGVQEQSLGGQERRDLFQQRQQAQDQQVQSILTPEQYQVYQNSGPAMWRGRGGDRGAPPPQR